MKKIILLFVLINCFQISLAQPGEHRERIKALKTAHITNELRLTSDEAEKFWPVYNASEERIHELKKEERKLKMKLGKGNDVSDSEAMEILDQFIAIEEKIHNEKKALITKLKKVLPAKKIIKLKKAEDNFNRKLLEELRKRRRNEHRGGGPRG